MAVVVRVINRFPEVEAAILAKIETATRTAAFAIESAAKRRAAVDTGNMRNSIHTSKDGAGYRVDSPAEYSIYQEFGTYKMAAHPFMIPAVEEVKPLFLAELKRIV